MAIGRRLSHLWRNLRHRRRVERDLDDELRAFVDLITDEHVKLGLGGREARRLALVELGGVEAVKEHVRSDRTGAFIDSAIQDVRYAARVLARSPLFTLSASVLLAIGVGAVTAVFTIANGLLLRPPEGIFDPDHLVDIVAAPRQGAAGVMPVSLAYFDEIRERATTLDGVYAYVLEPTAMSLRADDITDRVFATQVTPDYFRVLGVTASAGRVFTSSDDSGPTGAAIAVLSHDFWRRRFSSRREVVGQTVRINARPVTVVGIARDGFRGTSITAPDLWLPISTPTETDRFAPRLMLGGRLKPGVSRAQSAAEIQVLGESFTSPSDSLSTGWPRSTSPIRWSVVPASPLPFAVRRLAGTFLGLLAGIVGLVLMIASTNVAGLLLARAVSRRREIAVRTAIGAARGRIARQLLTETLVLVLLGGSAGLVLARVLTSMLLWLLPAFPIPVHVSVPLDWRVLGCALLLSLGAALFAGLTPARHASKLDVVAALKDDGPSGTDPGRLRYLFVVSQVALSVVLVVTAGLLLRKMDSTRRAVAGFEAGRVVVASIDWSTAGRHAADAVRAADALLDRVRRLPGVEVATVADRPPEARRTTRTVRELTVRGSTGPETTPRIVPNWHFVGTDYFRTVRLPILRGREFTTDDRAGGQPVVIVSEAAARQFWPGQDALGQQLAGASASMLTVIGVAKELTGGGSSDGTSPDIYVPIWQMTTSAISILARVADPAQTMRDLRALVVSVEPYVAPPDVRPLDAMTGPVQTQLRIATAVAGGVGIVGLVLALIGIYGVTAYVVARRKREFGIRLALGADRRVVIGLVLWHGMTIVGSGLLVGLVLAGGASRILGASPVGAVSPDPWVFGATSLLFVIAGLGACYAPARRAGRVDPIEMLRHAT